MPANEAAQLLKDIEHVDACLRLSGFKTCAHFSFGRIFTVRCHLVGGLLRPNLGLNRAAIRLEGLK